MVSDELLTSDEVASALRVSRSTVVRWARSGQLEAIYLPGKTIRYRRSDVERMLSPTAAEGSDPEAA